MGTSLDRELLRSGWAKRSGDPNLGSYSDATILKTFGDVPRAHDHGCQRVLTVRYVRLDGKRYQWRDILKVRREQVKQERLARQSTLFEMYEDARSVRQRSADGRY